MLSFKETCINLRKKDYTLSEIAKQTGRPKTSVYAHIRGMSLSTRKKDSILRKYAERIRPFALMRKGKSARKFKRFHAWNRDTVSLVAHCLFDGEIRRTGCSYNNRNIALIEQVETSMRTIYEFEPTRYKNPLTGVRRVSYHNVALGAFIKQRSRNLLKEVPTLPKHLKQVFLRAFFDDEGYADFRPRQNKRSVRGYQKDIRILKLIRKLLGDFNITSKIQMPNEIVVSGKQNLAAFQKNIDFTAGVRINGSRSNSIWRESLEKSELLRRAIASFK